MRPITPPPAMTFVQQAVHAAFAFMRTLRPACKVAQTLFKNAQSSAVFLWARFQPRLRGLPGSIPPWLKDCRSRFFQLAAFLKAKINLSHLLPGLGVLLLAANLLQGRQKEETTEIQRRTVELNAAGTEQLKRTQEAARLARLSAAEQKLDVLQLTRLQLEQEKATEDQRFQAYLMDHKVAVTAVRAFVDGANKAVDGRKSDAARIGGALQGFLGLWVGSNNRQETAEVADRMAQHEVRTKHFDQRLAELDDKIRSAAVEVAQLRM